MLHDDSRLVQDCINGNQTAWQELVAKYTRLVYSIPFRFDLSAPDADDVFQTVFTIVYKELPKLRNQASLASWLITITRRESLRVVTSRRPQDELGEEYQDPNTTPPEQVEQWEQQHLVHQALAQIDARCRELITALFIEYPKPSYDRIAARLDIPLGSIGPTRARCFKKLESVLTKMGFASRLSSEASPIDRPKS
jgi:RNA polymerase sigma factor (sigma-70 family)